jgi:oligopeptide/dipeptide ABC transporter ATP-binding protein
MEKEIALQVKDLELWFDNDTGSKKILNKISFDIYKGEALGIVGESGCGKSVTSLAIMQLLQAPPARVRGSIKLQNKELLTLTEKQMQELRGNRISMIFQEPMTSLNPVFTIGDQLMETFIRHQGMSKKEAKKKAVEMLRMVKIPLPEQRIKEYPHQLSGGMRQRVMIAMALACRPEILIADEPTTALDVTIQAQVLDLMRELQKELGTSIAFITHDLGVVSEMCDRVIVLYCGEVMEEASCEDLFANPQHPYTEGLLSTLPKFGQKGHLEIIPGVVPPAGKFPAGCVFAPRCKYATEKCHACKPGLYESCDGHKVRCFRYEQEVE